MKAFGLSIGRVKGFEPSTRCTPWKEKLGQSLKALRDERNALAAILKAGGDPIEVKAAERLMNQADQLQALQTQYDRLEEIADTQARLTVRSLFEQWQTLSLKQRVRSDRANQ